MILKKCLLLLLVALITLALFVFIGSMIGEPEDLARLESFNNEWRQWETHLLIWRLFLLSTAMIFWNKGVQWCVDHYQLPDSAYASLKRYRWTFLAFYLFVEVVMIQKWPQTFLFELAQ